MWVLHSPFLTSFQLMSVQLVYVVQFESQKSITGSELKMEAKFAYEGKAENNKMKKISFSFAKKLIKLFQLVHNR